MKKIAFLVFLIAQTLISQSRIATVNSGSHLIRTTDWTKFKNADILVEKLDGSKRSIYPFNTVRATNPNAMYVDGLQDDFEQGSEVKVYVLKPKITVIKSNPISAKVNSGSHLIKATDWSIYRNKTLLVEEVNGLNQNIYQFTNNRAINPNAMHVNGIDQDFEQNTDVYVYTIENFHFSNENLGIGTTNPDMKLTVKGNIHAEEVKIDLNVPAPDYVFKEDYNLRSIEELEKFIKNNSHLPETPSANEFEQNGLLLAQMDMNLLKKIEELTLYTIQQQKEIESLKRENKEVKSLNEKLLELQSRLEKLGSEK